MVSKVLVAITVLRGSSLHSLKLFRQNSDAQDTCKVGFISNSTKNAANQELHVAPVT